MVGRDRETETGQVGPVTSKDGEVTNRTPRVSMRSMLIGVAILSALLAANANSARRQHEVVSLVQQRFGDCYYDYSVAADGWFNPDGRRSWLSKTLGKDLVHSVRGVALGSHRLDDESSVTFHRPCKVDEELCERLSELPKLRTLMLDNTQVADDEIRALRHLRSLEILTLEHTGISSAAVEWLITHRNLHTLDVRRTALTEEDVQRIRTALPRCNVLY